MLYAVDDIQKEVRQALDLDTRSGQLIDAGDIDTLSVNELVTGKIEDAARAVETSAPVQLLHSGHTFGDTVFREGDGSGYLPLPDDFMRLRAFRMGDWERTVHTAIAESDPIYRLQSSRWAGLRGTPARPVCALVPRAEGLSLEFYSCRHDTVPVELALYLPYPRIEGGLIDLSPRCFRAVVYHTAGLVGHALGMERANDYFDISKSLLV